MAWRLRLKTQLALTDGAGTGRMNNRIEHNICRIFMPHRSHRPMK